MLGPTGVGAVYGRLDLLEEMPPFILGGVLAYIMNIPMMKMEKFVKAFIPDKYEDKYKGVIRAFSIVLSLLLLVLIIVVIAFLLIPELVENIESLMNNIPGLIESGRDFVVKLLDQYPDLQKEIEVITKFNGEDATILDVKKKSGTDTVTLVEQINKRLDELAEQLMEEYKEKEVETTTVTTTIIEEENPATEKTLFYDVISRKLYFKI